MRNEDFNLLDSVYAPTVSLNFVFKYDMLRKVHRLYMYSTINYHKMISWVKPSLLSRNRKITEAPLS